MDIMIDLETMDSETTAAMIAIGAVSFDNNTIINEFYTTVDLQDCIDLGLTVSAGTIRWWLEQEHAARKEFFPKVKMPRLKSALAEFQSWMEMQGNFSDRRVWGNGAAFDQPILQHAYCKAKMDLPWGYWNNRCYRTVKNQYKGIKGASVIGAKHNALVDARFQANHLIAIAQHFPGVLA